MRRRMQRTGGRTARRPSARMAGTASPYPETTTRGWRRHTIENDAVFRRSRSEIPMWPNTPADQAGKHDGRENTTAARNVRAAVSPSCPHYTHTHHSARGGITDPKSGALYPPTHRKFRKVRIATRHGRARDSSTDRQYATRGDPGYDRDSCRTAVREYDHGIRSSPVEAAGDRRCLRDKRACSQTLGWQPFDTETSRSMSDSTCTPRDRRSGHRVMNGRPRNS